MPISKVGKVDKIEAITQLIESGMEHLKLDRYMIYIEKYWIVLRVKLTNDYEVRSRQFYAIDEMPANIAMAILEPIAATKSALCKLAKERHQKGQ